MSYMNRFHTGMTDLRILIIDDHLLFADGLEMMLVEQDQNIRVDRWVTVQTAIDNAEILEQYDLAIVDLQLPELDGFSFLQMLRSQALHLKTVIVSGTESQSEIERAVALGALGLISKDSSKEEMLKGIRAVLNGKRYLPRKWVDQIQWPDSNQKLPDNPLEKVGPRQLEVLKMMGDGLQNKQIADVLGISVSAVTSHIKILFTALEVKNRAACVQAGIKRKLIS